MSADSLIVPSLDIKMRKIIWNCIVVKIFYHIQNILQMVFVIHKSSSKGSCGRMFKKRMIAFTIYFVPANVVDIPLLCKSVKACFQSARAMHFCVSSPLEHKNPFFLKTDFLCKV